MGVRTPFLCAVVLLIGFDLVQSLSGNVCSRTLCITQSRLVCAYSTWAACCSYKIIWEPVYITESYCCPGWRHNGSEVCNIPICDRPCINGGTCVAPNQCKCIPPFIGQTCDQSVCSYLSPCYPGTCIFPDFCNCTGGFTDSPSNSSNPKQNYCLQILNNQFTDIRIYQMNVFLSYWPRAMVPQMEKYAIMADSTNVSSDIFWTNRKDFNRLIVSCSSQYFSPNTPSPPAYIQSKGFGIVKGEVEVWLNKINPQSGSQPFSSLNKTIPCFTPVSSLNPETDIYHCNITDPNFDRLLEHGDTLKIVYKTTGGGYRITQTSSNQTYQQHTYIGVAVSKFVEFKFDFDPPHHCEEKRNCSGAETMLTVTDITKQSPLTIQWSGWQDDDSKMFRYSLEVFKMTKTIDNTLEIKPELALTPLVNIEVMHTSVIAPQQYMLPEAGMYSIILECADLANNTKYVRRLCLYDPSSEITIDPVFRLYAVSANNASDYKYQINISAPIVVDWHSYFRNAFHEDNALLGSVRPYPSLLEDFKKFIKPELDDHEGPRTIDAVPNIRGIVNFKVYHVKDHDGGLLQPLLPSIPISAWVDLGLNTTYIVPQFPSVADTVTVWVKATDAMGNEKIESTKVSFDTTPPEVQNISFNRNFLLPGIDFSSRFTVKVSDEESGIRDVLWTFTRSNGTVLYRERLSGRLSQTDCQDFTRCRCTPTRECFQIEQLYPVSNCRMMVEKAALATEKITVFADVTNAAGLVTGRTMVIGDLTTLNGTEAFYPPQNIRATGVSSDSVTLSWNFLPTCIPRKELWVVVGTQKIIVHKDSVQHSLTSLTPDTDYKVSMYTAYEGDLTSEPQLISFRTGPAPPAVSVGASVGIVIGILILLALVIFIVMFVLWRRGIILQQPGKVNSGMVHVSKVYDNIRKTVKRKSNANFDGTAFSNSAYKHDKEDEIYQYGEMAMSPNQAWMVAEDSLTLVACLKEGKFANIYKAQLQRKGSAEIVVAKMLKSGYSEEDAIKMMAKINFFAKHLDKHENVLAFIGAVTSHEVWGPVMLLEYCEGGQLDEWLTARRKNPDEQTMEHLFQFSFGIAKAMDYLASIKITHKRLAARNVLLTFLYDVKVAGFGPQHKESAKEKKTRVPIRWVAPEVLEDNPATEKSDVWSFGVVLWEIFSLGQIPYKDIQTNDVGTRLKKGYRMPKPEYADDEFYELMKNCWNQNPSNRPSFSIIRAKIASLYAPVRNSVDFYYDTDGQR